MPSTHYAIADFMADAKAILATEQDVEEQKAAIGEKLQRLGERDDLTRYGAQLGPTDASNGSYLLWREPPYFTLMIVEFHEGYLSPVHDHGEHWIVACCYRGQDRWDLYERKDEMGVSGPCDIELVDQVVLNPGDVISMPQTPRSIHSHNNQHSGTTLELIFSAVEPIPAAKRMIYDVPASTCRPSWYEISDQLSGDYFPPRPSDGA